MKSKDRVSKGYKEGSEDWLAEYNMLLDDGVTCDECWHSENRCFPIGYSSKGRTMCDFYPSQFIKRKEAAA